MTAAGNWLMFNSAKLYIGNGTIVLPTQTLNMTLHSSLYAPSVVTQSVYADLTNELSTANGYTSGGQALTGVTWAQSSGAATFDATDPSWTALGGSIGPFVWGVIRSTSTAVVAQPLICYCALDSAGLTVNTGQTVTISFNASGILTFTGATS